MSTASDTAAPTGWDKPKGLSKLGVGLVVAVALILNLPMIHYYLFRSAAPATVTLPYSDTFDAQQTITNNYFSTGGLWRIEDGQLLSPGVKNNPLWLKAKLPQNVSVEFDAKSVSPEGDIKVEIFGDGVDHASGYILVFGGWNNSVSIIARLDEHGKSMQQLMADSQAAAAAKGLNTTNIVETGVFRDDTRMRVEATPYPVQIGRTYHWKITRQGGLITWYIDGNEFMRFDDPIPLVGDRHDRFGFSSWEAQLYFDNLKVSAL